MQNFEDIMDMYPDKAKNLLLSCLEMQKDSTPDSKADYWEERHQIASHIKIIEEEISNMNSYEPIYSTKDN